MSEFDRTLEPESTPEQAKELANWLKWAIAERDERYRYIGHAFVGKDQLEEVPKEVAKHMPEVSPLSYDVAYEIYATQGNDYETGEPRTKGMIANVAFSQREFVDKGLIYATHVNYHIVSDGSDELHLECHVTATEHGIHKVRELHAQRDRTMTREGLEEQIDEWSDELRRIDETRPMETAAGMFKVTETEAQQIIDFCRSL